ncbi:hypothetical protein [Pectobacterium versatile]|uniref:hypothetical protein n=1 Tax=Pectobacterium versatile TaxID=2488639 RepID=UPI001F3539FF|nr:hypothetical protein [Pectobacterium versatile]
MPAPPGTAATPSEPGKEAAADSRGERSEPVRHTAPRTQPRRPAAHRGQGSRSAPITCPAPT